MIALTIWIQKQWVMASKHNLFKALLVKCFQCSDQGFVIFPRWCVLPPGSGAVVPNLGGEMVSTGAVSSGTCSWTFQSKSGAKKNGLNKRLLEQCSQEEQPLWISSCQGWMLPGRQCLDKCNYCAQAEWLWVKNYPDALLLFAFKPILKN